MSKLFLSEPKEVIISAVDKLVDFVKPTFGPAKHNILIEGLGVVDDGVTVARNFVTGIQEEDVVISIVKQVSEKTSKRVKDGTTGALILLQELLKHPVDGLREGLEEAKQQLLAGATAVTELSDLERVAEFACKNTGIAKDIAKLVKTLGADGVVSIQDSERVDITTEIIDGYEVESGLLSYYLVDAGKGEATLENPLVYLTKESISFASELVPILEAAVAKGQKSLVLVAGDIKGEALALLVLNKAQGRFNTVALKCGDFDTLEDLAAVSRTTVNQSINDLSFGEVHKVISSRENTLFFADKDQDRITQVSKSLESLKGYELLVAQQRLARLTNGVGVIRVGGLTEEEVREIKPKIENAVSATKLAYKSGVVDGAGLALSRIETSHEGLNTALKAPRKVLEETLGEIQEGVIDSVEVLTASIESAVSIAEMLLLTRGILIKKHDVQTTQ